MPAQPHAPVDNAFRRAEGNGTRVRAHYLYKQAGKRHVLQRFCTGSGAKRRRTAPGWRICGYNGNKVI